ncbi:MAG: hypothetical protein M1374_02440 [Firmicutes bacterium]|jgi:phosphate transport system protein|nr:hypothetical protein [Bacillota bacterium]
MEQQETANEIFFVDRRVSQLFANVSEALAAATDSLLGGETITAQHVVDGDSEIDILAAQVQADIWTHLSHSKIDIQQLKHLVGLLLILPELERSADLAEHIAQRALVNLGSQMTPTCRGSIQRMSEVALEMWHKAAKVYTDSEILSEDLDEDDEEMDILYDRLIQEVAKSSIPNQAAAQIALTARFYERLGDHAVNLARRIETLSPIATIKNPDY